MPLQVGTSTFDANNINNTMIDTIIDLIDKLPQPKILPNEQSNVKAEKTVLCLQREIVYVNEFLNPTIEYIGSQDVFSCILVYVYSSVDHLAIHVDNTKDLSELINQIKNFSEKHAIKVKLVGGGGRSGYLMSKEFLKEIINALLVASKEFNIEIVEQKILHHNKANELTLFLTYYDEVLRKANILSNKFFNEDFLITEDDHHRFSLRNVKKPIKSEKINKEKDRIFMMIKDVFFGAKLYYSEIECKLRKIEQNVFLSCIKSKENFKEFTYDLLTRESFNKSRLEYIAKIKSAGMTNFVFSIKTGNLIPISEHLNTPHEKNRLVSIVVVVVDPTMIISNHKAGKYFLAFDGKSNHYNFHVYSSTFLNKCYLLQPVMKKNELTDELIFQHFRSFIGGLDSVADFVNSLKEKTCIKNDIHGNGHYSLFFKPNIQYADLYLEKLSRKTVMLENLINLIGLPFEAHLRKTPVYTVDALCDCKSKLLAEHYQKELATLGIQANIVILEDKPYLSVPGINVIEQAQNIQLTFRK